MALSDRLKSILSERDMSEYKLSKVSGVKTQTINLITKGITQNPGKSTLTKLAEALNMSLDELVGNSDDLDQINGMEVFKNSIGDRTSEEFAEYLYKLTGKEVHAPYIQDVLNGERKINKSLLTLIEEAENPVKQEKKQITACEKCEIYLPLIKKIEDNNLDLNKVNTAIDILIMADKNTK